MEKIPLQIGSTFKFSKTVSESDIYLFAGISGDFSPNHIDEEYMKKTQYKQRIAHGVLSLAFASTTSSIVAMKVPIPSVSYGYDHIRFLKPVFIGDTLTVQYTIIEIDEDNSKTVASIEIRNQDNILCTVAKHILKFFP